MKSTYQHYGQDPRPSAPALMGSQGVQGVLSFVETRSRRTDPETSKRAGINSARFANSHKARILAALKQHGPMSPKKIFCFTGLDIHQCDRRRKEMLAEGSIKLHRDAAGNVVEESGCEVWEAL